MGKSADIGLRIGLYYSFDSLKTLVMEGFSFAEPQKFHIH